MSRAVTWIGFAAGALLVIALFVAIAQPGDLGDDDADDVALSTSTTQPESTTTTPTTGPSPTEAPTTAPPAGEPGTGTGNGSGLGTGGTGSAQPGELVDSGHESLAVPGLLLAGAGALAARRRRA